MNRRLNRTTEKWKSLRYLWNKRQTSKTELQLGQIIDSLAQKVPGGQEGTVKFGEHKPWEGFCLVLLQHLTLGNDGEILISENAFHKKDRDYNFQWRRPALF